MKGTLDDSVVLRGTTLRERLHRQASTGSTTAIHPSHEDLLLLEEWANRLGGKDLLHARLGSLAVSSENIKAPWSKSGLRDVVAEDLAKGDSLLWPDEDQPFAWSPSGGSHQGLPPLPPVLEAFVERHLRTALFSAGSEQHVELQGLLISEAQDIRREVHALVLPCTVTELHRASWRGDLTGTPEERYQEFVTRVVPSERWARELLANYPVLFRQLVRRIRNRAHAFWEMIERFSQDRGALLAAGLLGSPDDRAASISSPMGDSHRFGRTVRVLETAGGSRLVYKPRPVEIDGAFLGLISWFNDQGFEPALFEMAMLPRPGYGWFEYVGGGACSDEASVGRFYRRHGAHVALLYLLGGYDFFRENVIAHGEYPVLVDLECAHAPARPSFGLRLFESSGRAYFDESVYRGGLLPAWTWVHLGRQGVNLSPLTRTEVQALPIDSLEWAFVGTDQLCQRRVQRTVPLMDRNLPKLDGVAVPVTEHMDDFLEGFRQAYHVIASHRQTLLATSDGPLSAFCNVHCRVVLRSTVDYSMLLRGLGHPLNLSDGLRWGLLADRLWESLSPRHPADVIESEIDQLWEGDIPVFMIRGGGSDLCDGFGTVVCENYVKESALEGARRRLRRWGPDDMARQEAIINGAFAIMDLPHVGTESLAAPVPVATDDSEGLELDAILAESRNIGDRILEMAIEDQDTLTWIGLGVNTAGQWDQRSLDAGLYDGGPGIAMLLLGLYKACSDRRYGDAVEKIIGFTCNEPSRKVLESSTRVGDWVLAPPSPFSFPFSSFYLALHARSAGLQADIGPAVDVGKIFAEIGLERAPRHDFVSGAAGLIVQLLLMHEATEDPGCIHLAKAYGDRLLEHSTPIRGGIGWHSDTFGSPIGGFAHGASGIAWALARLGSSVGDERYLAAAQQALQFDRSLFSWRDPSWIDLRGGVDAPGSAVQWCHGLAGIALSRALLSRYIDDPELLHDAESATASTLAAQSHSDCLCHGSLGNLDCMLVVHRYIGGEAMPPNVWKHAAETWHNAHSRGYWRTGAVGHRSGLCGLFMGTAGIGYGLLRLALRDMIPSVLCLDGPVKHPMDSAGHLREASTPRA